MNPYINAEVVNAQQLIGARIQSIIVDGLGEYWGLHVQLTNGSEVDAWVNRDPEANGPGHLEIEPYKGRG